MLQKMVRRRRSKFVLYIAIFFTVFTILPILAPLFARLGLDFLSTPIYWIYQWFCHQRPWRSYHLFDYQFAIDARMMSIFSSIAISSFAIYIKKIRPLGTIPSLILGIVFTLPLALDGTIQGIAEIITYNQNALPFYESTNLIRAVTGVLMGVGLSFALFPILNDIEGREKTKKFFSFLLLSAVISFVLIPSFVFMWSITSVRYSPTSLFFDSEKRFPGYNYEISRGASHSTLKKRVINEPLQRYIERAQEYSKKDILDTFYKERSVNR